MLNSMRKISIWINSKIQGQQAYKQTYRGVTHNFKGTQQEVSFHFKDLWRQVQIFSCMLPHLCDQLHY